MQASLSDGGSDGSANNAAKMHHRRRQEGIRCALQGFGVQVSPLETGKPEFREALLEVLTNPKYTVAAQALSAKIRARKNTPVQEAAGALFL